MSEQAIRDQNHVTAMLFKGSDGATYNAQGDEVTGRLYVDLNGAGIGTVTSVSVVSANGFAGTVATATTTPAITISTTITGLLKGNGTAISAAVANTDYQSPITLTTTGTSGAATFNGTTLNIPQYQAAGTYVTSVSGTATRISSSGGTTPVIDLIATAVTPGSYTNTDLTVDAYGRITAASNGSAGSSGITIGTTTITSGTNTRILYNNAGVVGEYTLTGTGTVVAMQTSPSFITSVIGGASFDVFNTTSTTVNAFGAATTLTVGGTPTTAITHNYSTNATANATTKTINLGTGGAVGSTTNINLGSANGGTVTINAPTLALGTGSITMTGSLGATGARVTKGWFTDLESTNAPTVSGSAVYYSGGIDVAVADGGTGKSSWTQYLIPYADTTTSFSQIAIGTSGQVLTSNGAGAAPTFQTPSGGGLSPTSVGSFTFELPVMTAATADVPIGWSVNSFTGAMLANQGAGGDTFFTAASGSDPSFSKPLPGVGSTSNFRWSNISSNEVLINFKCKLSSVSTNDRIGFGFGDSSTTFRATRTDTTIAARFVLEENSGNKLYAVISDGSTNQNTDITSGAGTLTNWHVFSISMTSSLITFYIDGSSVATFNTNLPTAASSIEVGYGITATSTDPSMRIQRAIIKLPTS